MNAKVRGMKTTFVLVLGMMFLASCATTTPKKSGFLGEYYNKLKPGLGEDDPKLIWIKPGVDFTRYKKVMVDYVIFALADDSEYKGIDGNEMKKIGDGASRAFVNALQKEFPLVSEPGPDVLRIRTAIVDLKQGRPALSALTIPVDLAVSIVNKGARDSWTGSGTTTAEMMVLDSMSNEVLAAAEDQKVAGVTERFTKWGSVEELFTFWGERLTERMAKLLKKK